MNTEERCNLYAKYKEKLFLAKDLEEKLAAAKKAGDEAFKNHIGEEAYEAYEAYEAADKTGWLLADDLLDAKNLAKREADSFYNLLCENAFDLTDYYSCCAYGRRDIKKVKVILLDDTELQGEIYPYVYDNAQEMYLKKINGETLDLDEGWEVKEVIIV